MEKPAGLLRQTERQCSEQPSSERFQFVWKNSRFFGGGGEIKRKGPFHCNKLRNFISEHCTSVMKKAVH